MNDQIGHLRRTEEIQEKICGKMVSLKKEINRILEKAERTLKQQR